MVTLFLVPFKNRRKEEMKIAIPTKENQVDNHFGNCELYTIVDVSDNKQITNIESFKPPLGCGCKSELAQILKNMGVTTMLAGNMGVGAVHKILDVGIDLYRGCSGDVKVLAEEFLNDKIKDLGSNCDHHHDHQCNH